MPSDRSEPRLSLRALDRTHPGASTSSGRPGSGSTSSLRTFGEFSEFFRAAVADEESLQMAESLQRLSQHIEAMTEEWRLPHPDAMWLAPGLLTLLDALREHHAMLLDLNRDWGRFLEYNAHLAALNQFRSQVTQWVQLARLRGAQPPTQADFDLNAWRFLGAGALLLDVYEQSSMAARKAAPARQGVWSRLVQWIRGKCSG